MDVIKPATVYYTNGTDQMATGVLPVIISAGLYRCTELSRPTTLPPFTNSVRIPMQWSSVVSGAVFMVATFKTIET